MNRRSKITALFAAALILSAFSAFVFVFLPTVTNAQIPGGLPFGGLTITYVLPTSTCPFAHTLVYDFTTQNLIGLTETSGVSRVYDNGNFKLAGKFVLGTYSPTPLVCAAFYRLHPLVMAGTS